MKSLKFIGIGFVLCLVLGIALYFPTYSQKKVNIQWEYCAITNTSIPYSVDKQVPVIGIANVCYLETQGCKNEEVKVEFNYAKFLIDFRLENNSKSLELATNRLADIAFSSAVAKLGLDGWEIISSPSFEFDSFTLNNGNRYDISEGEKHLKPNVYFKRPKQN
jgi:hypothetical protein